MPLPQKRLVPGILLALMIAAIAAPPFWWGEGDPPVIDPAAAVNNHGPANIGQAKHMAKSALDALRTVLPFVANQIEADLTEERPNPQDPENPLTPILDFSVPDPKTPEWLDKQKAPLLIGQLKAIADPFYNRLHAASPAWLEAERTANGTQSPNSIFPWTAETTDDANKAIANIGQLKAVFSLQFDALSPFDPNDGDGDGLPDAWEIAHGLSLTANSASGLFQGGPATNLQAYQQGVQAIPGATLQNKDGDDFDNDLDAVPDDGEINWPKTPEKRYVWIEQVMQGGAKAVSKHGHILFPKNNVEGSNLENVLWDSNISDWVVLTGASSWSGSGFLLGYLPFDAE